MATRKGHTPGGPLSGNLTPKATGAVSVPDRRAPLAGTTAGDHPPFSDKRRPKSGAATAITRPSSPARQGPGDPQVNWSRKEPDQAAIELRTMFAKHESTLSWRHFMAMRGAAAWSGVGLGDLFENLSPWDGPNDNGYRGRKGRKAFKYGGWQTKEAEQWARANCETVNEKLFGLDMPKTQRVATDVEWELRRQGIWADRWSEGNMHLPQGTFLDTWDLARQGALLAFASTGTVAARVEPDYVAKRVRTQLRSTLNTFIDPGDVANGMPLSYFDVTWENPEYMIEDERFHEHRDAIWKAAEVPPHHAVGSYEGASFGTKMVKWMCAWRMPFGDQKKRGFKGRCAIVVPGVKTEPIWWDTWDTPTPPLAFFRVNRCLGENFWGENFIEIMLDPLSDAADIDDMAKEVMRLTSQMNITLDGTSTAAASVLNAKTVNIHRYDSKKGEKEPGIKPGLLMSRDYFEWQARKLLAAQQLSGVPALHSSSESPAHLQSGKAIRLEASLLPERFARKLRNWRQWVAVDISNLQVRAAREIGKIDPDWQVTWPGVDFDSKVSVEVLDIDDTAYQIRPYAVSESKNTPADRAEYAQELFDRKEISSSQLQVILDGLFDTPKETKESSAQRREIAKTVDDMLHAPEGVIANESKYMAERYSPPDPWTDPPSALAQIIPLYRQARVDGVPQNRRNLIRRLLEDVLAIQMQNARDAATANASVSVKAGLGEALPVAPQAGMLPPAPAPVAGPGPADMGLGAPMAPELAQPNVGGPVGIA